MGGEGMKINDVIYFIKRKVIPGFKIPKNALVIDLGSGDKPFWRADVYADKLDLADNQRATKSRTLTGFGYFIDSDLSKTPFKDKAFDFSFCSHVLEHVEDPKKVIKEMMRISKSGYIEVPNGIFDSINPFPTHLWLIYLNDNKFVFVRKDKKMTEILKKNGENFKFLSKKVKDPFIRVYWKDEINYEIIDSLNQIDNYKLNEKNENINSKKSINISYKIIIKIIRLLFYKNKNLNIKEIIK